MPQAMLLSGAAPIRRFTLPFLFIFILTTAAFAQSPADSICWLVALLTLLIALGLGAARPSPTAIEDSTQWRSLK